MRILAAASQPWEFRAAVQRLSARGADNRAWDAVMAAAQEGDTSSYHRLRVFQ